MNAGPVQERLQLSDGDRRAELPEGQRAGAGGPRREQPPCGPLAEGKDEHQSLLPGHDMGGTSGEISIEFGVGEHDLHRAVSYTHLTLPTNREV